MSFKAIDIYRGTRIVSLYNFYTNLLDNQIVNSDLLAIQRSRLVKFLIELKVNRYYSTFLEKIKSDDIEEKPYEILSLLPITDKAMVTANYDRIRNQDYKFERAFTGGSTGAPFHYLIDKNTISETRAFSYALWNKFLGYNLGERVIVVAGSSLGKSESIKQRVYNKLQNKHFIFSLNRGVGEAKLLAEHINRSRKACFLYAYPSKLAFLTKIIKEYNIQVNTNKVSGIICTSEMLFDNQKHFLSEFFGSEVLNMYGANDGGIASGSVNNISFIYNGLGCYAENIQIDGQNEIVLTSLSSFAFPMVRYRVGDIGEVGCDYKGYPFVITDLKGRSRDLVYINKNQCIHGSEFNKIFKTYPFIIDYQIEQFSDHTCAIKLGCKNFDFKPESIDEIRFKIKKLLNNTPFEIEIAKDPTTNRNGKLKNIISHVN